MAMKFAAREVLVLATEDDRSGRSNSENRESVDGAIRAYRGKTRFSTEGLEDVGAIMEEAIPGPGLCSFSTRRISWVTEDELQEEDHLGKCSAFSASWGHSQVLATLYIILNTWILTSETILVLAACS